MKTKNTKRQYPKGNERQLARRLLKEMGNAGKFPNVNSINEIIKYAKRIAESNKQSGQMPTNALGVLQTKWPNEIKWLREMRKLKDSKEEENFISHKQALEFARKLNFINPNMSAEERKEGLKRALNYLVFLGIKIKK
ncbi:MAG: hypothetical protein QXZ13_02820 [Candidatus Diapherotrites archaeon]